MPLIGDIPHHIPGNPSPSEVSGPTGGAEIDPSGNVAGNPSPASRMFCVADQGLFAVNGNPEPGSIMSGS